jgi:putative metallohydrolase (TIGR04338 family)
MKRDTQRSRVYKCDEIVNALAKPLPRVPDIERYVRKVFVSKRVRAAFPKAVRWSLPVVKDGRGRRRAGGWSGGITIPLWARNEGVVLHELAHTICEREYRGVAGHGWEFCSIYLRLVLYMMGREAHDALKRAFKANRVRFTEPRKRKPLDPERRAALIARLAEYRGRSRASEAVAARFAGLDL